ncbi:hypothetical protein [Hyunsoonleella ulvae]|uniref:hypothetical protein n=1 Tax=Hyunsoonleella ulvae TaxID=2799948 RepID=UPI00193A5F62|nr:hypothetical protein [Hyunsoonleella ulvae]
MKNIFHIFQKQLIIEIIDKTNRGFEHKIEPLINEMISRNFKKVLVGKTIEIVIPNDYKKTVYLYATAEKKEHYNQYGIEERKAFLVLPENRKTSYFTIILNQNIFEDYQYYSTIYQELTHVLDYTYYFKKYGNMHVESEEVKKINYYFEYYLWSEFNSKRKGLERLQKEKHVNNWDVELQTSLDQLKQDVHGEQSHLSKLYYLMHFFARISVYDDGFLTPESTLFSNEFLNCNYGAYTNVIYTTVSEIKSFTEFEKEKDFLKFLMFNLKPTVV